MQDIEATNEPRGGRARARWRRLASASVAALMLAALLAACGSSSKKSGSTSAQLEQRACEQVEAALSDGPDPEADPVGHAEAQIIPLRKIHTSDAKLQKGIDGLESAYQSLSSSNGAGSTESAVDSATKRIEALCPGIES